MSAQRVLAASYELVKVLQERRDVTVSVKDDCVVMVRFGEGEQNVDAELDGRKRQAIDERVVRCVIGPKQEHALRAAAREHVELARKNLPWLGHALTEEQRPRRS